MEGNSQASLGTINLTMSQGQGSQVLGRGEKLRYHRHWWRGWRGVAQPKASTQIQNFRIHVVQLEKLRPN